VPIRPDSFVIYDGPSVLPGFAGPRILVVVTPPAATPNRKLGDMWQAWILVAKTTPGVANRHDDDRAICGNCVHRKGNEQTGRTCYVPVWRGPQSIWRREQREPYPRYSNTQIRSVLNGGYLRIGAYGDPAAVPLPIWQLILPVLAGWTGYTHFWRDPANAALRYFLMASVDNAAEQREARLLGWRTFRCRTPEELLARDEIVCPASAEAGHQTVCQKCQLCQGNTVNAKSIAIVAHGRAAQRFIRTRTMRSLLA